MLNTSTRTVTTKYDCTAPGIDGTEITFVTPDGKTVSGYCQDNIISQHIDDEISRSPNGANLSSGVKSVILYRVTGKTKEVINTNQTKKIFSSSDTHSYFDMYYEIADTEKRVSYYEIIVVDFAGNTVKKKLTSQYSLLSWFHTSIDRSSFDKALLVVGKDIQEGQYVIECTETKSYSTKILLFDSKDTYLAYHVSSRFTNGEEQDAIDANSKASSWIQSGKSFSTYLSEGNILVIDGGNVKITTME